MDRDNELESAVGHLRESEKGVGFAQKLSSRLGTVRTGLQMPCRAIAVLGLASVLLITGCKTSEDAIAAATQMSATAKSLADYYSALGTILANTDQLYRLEDPLLSKPYMPAAQKQLSVNESELAKRVALASDLSTLAATFAKLTGSTAPADVAAAAVKCQTEVDSLASEKASSTEQNVLKGALQVLVTAVQERKEREAAKAMDDVAKSLSALFAKEAPIWNSSEQVYIQHAEDVAKYLAKQDDIGNSSLLKVALDPFGMTPIVSSPKLKAALTPIVDQQIETKAAALNASYRKATDAMTASLQEMSQRIHVVAVDKPMSFRAPPLTVATVEQWATQITKY